MRVDPAWGEETIKHRSRPTKLIGEWFYIYTARPPGKWASVNGHDTASGPSSQPATALAFPAPLPGRERVAQAPSPRSPSLAHPRAPPHAHFVRTPRTAAHSFDPSPLPIPRAHRCAAVWARTLRALAGDDPRPDFSGHFLTCLGENGPIRLRSRWSKWGDGLDERRGAGRGGRSAPARGMVIGRAKRGRGGSRKVSGESGFPTSRE